MSLIGKEITEFEAQAFHENEFKTIKKEDLLGKWNVQMCIRDRPLPIRLAVLPTNAPK